MIAYTDKSEFLHILHCYVIFSTFSIFQFHSLSATANADVSSILTRTGVCASSVSPLGQASMSQTPLVDHCQPGNVGDRASCYTSQHKPPLATDDELMTSKDQMSQFGQTRPQVPCTDKSLPLVQNNGIKNQSFHRQVTDDGLKTNVAPAGQTQTPISNEKSQSLVPQRKNIPQPEKFPSTLEGFGYKFNEEGALMKIIDEKTGETSQEKFEFNVSKDHRFNQNRYEALGKVVDEHVYKLMEEAGLKKFPVPFDATESEPQTFVFATPDFLKTSADKNLLILIHGSGVVRAGQWARRLIINEFLDAGTQLPYIKKAMELGYNVLVLNTNDNKRETLFIRGSENPVEHALHVWDNYVVKPKSAKVAIVAHSFGGVCTSILAQERREEFAEKVFAVAFTDSVHDILRGDDFRHLRNVGRNWCASNDPLDGIVERMSDEDMTTVSAGHIVHEWTSYKAFESVFKYIEEKRAFDSKGKPGNGIGPEYQVEVTPQANGKEAAGTTTGIGFENFIPFLD